MPCQRRVRGRGGCGARRPRRPRGWPSEPSRTRGEQICNPPSENEFLSVAVLPPTPHFAPRSPFPLALRHRPLGVPHLPAPSSAPISQQDGGGGSCRRKPAAEAPRRGWGWGPGVRDLFTRKSRGRGCRCPGLGPRALCRPEPRAPAAAAGQV